MSKYITLTNENFDAEVLQSEQPVLVDFWATWCGPCVALAPTIEALAEAFDGRAKIAKLDVDAAQELAARYGIQSIPAVFFFRDGEVVDRVIGLRPKAELAERLEALLAADATPGGA